MSIGILISLILFNLIWAANPLMSKLLLEHHTPEQVIWFRYMSAFITMLIAMVIKSEYRPKKLALKIDWINLMWIACITFFLSPILQISGLFKTGAVDNALIIALEPLICTFLAWIILKERPHGSHAISFIFAILGFSLLSGLTPEKIKNGLDPRSTGNLLILLSLCGEAVYSIAGRRLVPKYRPGSIFGMALGVGVIFLTLYLWVSGSMPALTELTLREWVAILWLGPVATAAGYLYWMWALQFASVATLSVTLFVQPVAGAVFGSFLLGERFSETQWTGGLIILLAVFAQDRIEKKFSKNA